MEGEHLIWNWKDREHINGLGKESKEIEEVKMLLGKTQKQKNSYTEARKHRKGEIMPEDLDFSSTVQTENTVSQYPYNCPLIC